MAAVASKRNISFREMRALLDCTAKWDFMYGEQLAGSSLTPKTTAALLNSGSLWDVTVKTYNKQGLEAALKELHAVAPANTAEDQQEFEKMTALIRRYAHTNPMMGTVSIEPYDVPVSPILNLTIRPDDVYVPLGDGIWYVEYKLRKSLTSIEYLQRDFQTKLYVWGARKIGHPVLGVIMDETLNEMPAEVRYNNDGRPSKTQTCSADDYRKGCISGGYVPDPMVLKKLETRKVHQRVPIYYESFDLDDIEDTINAAYSHITYLERGIIRPTRIRYPMMCRLCTFNSICEHPEPDAVDFLYDRKPAKKDRNEVS